MSKLGEYGVGFHEIPFKEYLEIEAFSKSQVSSILKSPAHLKARLNEPIKSKSLSLGSLVDCLVLEPELFSGKYVVTPATYVNDKDEIKKWSGNAKVCKEWTAKIALSGKEIVKSLDLEKAMAMDKSLMESVVAQKLLSGKKQVSALWYDPKHGVPCKGRFDVLNDGNITDLKTTSGDATPKGFSMEAYKYNYHVQAAAYLEAYEQIQGEAISEFNFVVVETSAPFSVGSFTLREDSIMLGKMFWERALGIYKECLNTGEWGGYEDKLVAIDVPAWALKPIEEGFAEDLVIESF